MIVAGNVDMAVAHIGVADKFYEVVRQEGQIRGLHQLHKRQEIAPGVIAEVFLCGHQSVLKITARAPMNPKLEAQVREYMCLCTSCFTMGIVSTVTYEIYSSKVRYTVLVCSRDKDDDNRRDHPEAKRPRVGLRKNAKDVIRVKPNYMVVVPAQPSDGALYEVGEIVVLIPHPFGMNGASYGNAQFLEAGSVPNPQDDKTRGGCDIDQVLGAVIVPVELQGVAAYYKKNGLPMAGPGSITHSIPSHEVVQIPAVWPFGRYQEGDKMRYVDAYDVLASYTLHYARITAADRDTGDATVVLLDTSEEMEAFTVSNADAKRVNGQWPLTPLTSANGGHIYTATPPNSDPVWDIVLQSSYDWRITHNDVVAVVLASDNGAVVLGLGRKLNHETAYTFPVRHERVCFYYDSNFLDAVTGQLLAGDNPAMLRLKRFTAPSESLTGEDQLTTGSSSHTSGGSLDSWTIWDQEASFTASELCSFTIVSPDGNVSHQPFLSTKFSIYGSRTPNPFTHEFSGSDLLSSNAGSAEMAGHYETHDYYHIEPDAPIDERVVYDGSSYNHSGSCSGAASLTSARFGEISMIFTGTFQLSQDADCKGPIDYSYEVSGTSLDVSYTRSYSGEDGYDSTFYGWTVVHGPSSYLEVNASQHGYYHSPTRPSVIIFHEELSATIQKEYAFGLETQLLRMNGWKHYPIETYFGAVNYSYEPSVEHTFVDPFYYINPVGNDTMFASMATCVVEEMALVPAQ